MTAASSGSGGVRPAGVVFGASAINSYNDGYPRPEWRNGIRCGLKHRWAQALVSSNLTSGTTPALGALLVMLLSGCAALAELSVEAPAQQWDGPAPMGDPTCLAERYDFVGEGTLAGLGLDTATPVEPPTPNQPAMIWVTADLQPHDAGAEGGPVEMTRMLCFEFADGSGGSAWPVDPAWRPPGQAAPIAADGVSVPPTLLLVGLAVLLAIGVSAFAFRRRG